jgi:hypothetical protein
MAADSVLSSNLGHGNWRGRQTERPILLPKRKSVKEKKVLPAMLDLSDFAARH